MDDLAPVQPARAAARLWCAALGLGCVALGALPLLGVRGGGLSAATPSFVFGAIALLVALAPLGYRGRAVAMILLGALGAGAGLGGFGPAEGIAVGGLVPGILRVLSATLLPAALLFRARYRAFAGARWILGGGFVLALPFSGYAIVLLAAGSFGFAQVGAILALGGIVAGLFGFMGAETTGAASYTAFGIVLGLASELGLEAWGNGADDPLRLAGISMCAAAFAALTSIVAVGLFQVLAGRFAADARRIDLHAGPRADIDLAETEDWSTR